jgi:alkyl hydroperoxide reductase subunit D
MKNLEELKSAIPDFAKDVKINLGNLLNQENQLLSAKQVFGSALTAAYVIDQKDLVLVMENESAKILSDAEISATRTSASLMAMNNIYYRFLHIINDKEYSQMPAGLRMQGIVNHGIDKTDFEVFSLAASVINGCGMCIEAHSQQLIKHQMTKSQIQMIAKIAAVINSVAQVLRIGIQAESKN